MLKFIIDTEKCVPAGKYGVIVNIGLKNYLLNSWSYFMHKERDGVKIVIGKKVTLYIDSNSPYCVICNDLLMIQRRYPECLKAGQKATLWLNEYKSLVCGKR